MALDSVLFADGTLKGPDVENSFERWTNFFHVHATFDKAVLAFEGRTTGELRQYLATAAATPMRHIPGGQNERELAESYEHQLDKRGPEALFRQTESNLKEITAISIHR